MAEQGALFPNSAIPDEYVGYRGATACQVTGITYRQLDYWERKGYLRPHGRPRLTNGSGFPREFSDTEVAIAENMRALIDVGFTVSAASYIAQRIVADPTASEIILSDELTLRIDRP